MINGRLTTSEAAERLGVKPATLYAYVSRGLLRPEKTSRGSTFDVQEVARLARTARHPRQPVVGPRRRRSGGDVADPVFVTAVSCIDGGRLYYRGRDAVGLSRRRRFEEVAWWLWTGRSEVQPLWPVPAGTVLPLARTMAALPAGTSPVERFTAAVVTAAMCDELRHDLNPDGVAVTGRHLLAVLAASLPAVATAPRGSGRGAERPPTGALAGRVWTGLTSEPASEAALAVMDAALILAADHELAPSTLSARVTASFRADPYAAVLSGLGPASGSWQPGSTGAPGEVEALLEQAAESGAERALGDRLRRGQVPHGFGMPLYPGGDPRAAELLSRLDDIGCGERAEVVRRVVDLGRQRGFPPPNFDLGLGALSFCAGMVPGAGQAVFTLAKVAGWLAHAIEEYERPTRFRIRADYVGPALVAAAVDGEPPAPG